MQEEEEADFGQTEPAFDFQEEEVEPSAKRPRGEVGGKRQKRRVTLVNAKLASGEWLPEEVELVGPLEGWIIHNNQLAPPSQQLALQDDYPLPEEELPDSGTAGSSADPAPSEIPPWIQERWAQRQQQLRQQATGARSSEAFCS